MEEILNQSINLLTGCSRELLLQLHLMIMTKIELIRIYCQAQAPCGKWNDAIIDDLGGSIRAFATDGNDLTFTLRNVALWAMNQAQQKIMEILF